MTMASAEDSLREQLKRKEAEIEELKKERMVILNSALKQSRINKELEEQMNQIMEVNKKLTERLKKK